MTLPNSTLTMEHRKFYETPDGDVAVRTGIFTGLIDFAYDYVEVTYPTATSEVYEFKIGGSGGTSLATVTLVYTDSTKVNLSTVTKA